MYTIYQSFLPFGDSLAVRFRGTTNLDSLAAGV